MKRILVIIACLVAAVAHAEVYKWVDEHGEVHFGDLPPATDQAEKVKLPPLRSKQARTATEAGEDGSDAGPFEGYSNLLIIQPDSGATVRNASQTVTVFVSLKPGLQDGHQVSLLLDGDAIGAGVANAPVDLTGVAYGDHTVQAKVMDQEGKLLIESAPVRFQLRPTPVASP